MEGRKERREEGRKEGGEKEGQTNEHTEDTGDSASLIQTYFHLLPQEEQKGCEDRGFPAPV